MICVPLAEPDADRARAAMVKAATRADLVEIRLDQFQAPPTAADLAALLKDRPCPVIITNRPASEGGKSECNDDVRVTALQAAIELGADYIDVELNLADRIERTGHTRIIVSYHNFTSTPLNIGDFYTRIVDAGADVAKVATTANSLIDNLRIFDLLKGATIPCIALCMGSLGRISRILARRFGTMLTYAPMDPAKPTASGQIPLDEMIALYNYRSITAETRIYGVIGNPIGHSLSPHIHNAAFRSLGLNAVYVPFKVEGDVCNFLDAYRGLPVHGYSVTIPHKEAVSATLDEIDTVSRQIGAVNTIVNRKGCLVGSNTDWTAAVAAIESELPDGGVGGKRVALLGAGGTARAIAFGLKARGATTTIYNRTSERAEKLAADVGCAWAPLDAIETADVDVIANSTSVGMYPIVDASPVPASVLMPGMVVFDAVYNPVWTRLLAEADKAGCRTVSGIHMFVNQAAEQFKTWTGLDAPRELMETVTRERLAALE